MNEAAVKTISGWWFQLWTEVLHLAKMLYNGGGVVTVDGRNPANQLSTRFYTSQVVSRISEPSTVCIPYSPKNTNMRRRKKLLVFVVFSNQKIKVSTLLNHPGIHWTILGFIAKSRDFTQHFIPLVNIWVN